MTTDSVPDSTSSAASGIATLTAVAALGNSRSLSGSKRILLDAQVYVGSPNCESLLGALAYFNGSDMSFNNDAIGLYLIYATIAKVEEGADLRPTPVSPAKYDFIGDIQWIIPLTPPIASQLDDDPSKPDFFIDPCQRAYLHVSGVASNSQKQQGTFDLDVEHYVSSFKDVKVDSKPIKPIAPISCIIPDSPRYKQGKPVPFNKRYVSVSGFLSDVIFKKGTSDTIQRFQLSVENIVFLGQQLNPAGNVIPNQLDSPVRTPRAGKGLINYNRKTPASPATPTPSRVPPRKRQRLSFDSSSDSLQKENVQSTS